MLIKTFEPRDLAAVVELSLRAWEPVFAGLEQAMDIAVYRELYPNWRRDQMEAVKIACIAQENMTWVAKSRQETEVMGFVVLRFHAEAHLGEIYMLAVDPRFQRRGVGRMLLEFAIEEMKAAGMRVAMVETGGDEGHGPARDLYEKSGFDLLPIARYFKSL